MNIIKLNWIGPFNYNDTSSNRPIVPNQAGIYIWVAGSGNNKFITYVGEAGNIRNRLYNHMLYTLGGGYNLNDFDKFIKGDSIEECYKSNPDNMNIDYIMRYEELSRIAYKSLVCLDIYFTIFKGTDEERKRIESCIIRTLKNEKNKYSCMLQNYKFSVSQDESKQIHVISEFQDNNPTFQLLLDMYY